jgi:carboxypeptidase T
MKSILFILFSTFCLYLHGQILSYTSFRTPAQVDTAINTLASTYPSLTHIQTLGNSIEGRPIRALKISNTPTVNDPSKGDVVYMALIHAREWITVETLLYIADKLLAQYSTNAALKKDLDNIQLWIIPVCNPDGYNYSATTDRYWRKNRRNNGDGTFGVDLNRNWGYQWGLLSGSSNITSSETYHGVPPAFSENETQVLRNFISGLTNLKALVSYHSFSELYLRPWSYTTADPPGEPTLKSIVQRNIGLIQSVHGLVYAETIGYTASGETTDYIWNQYRSAAFTPELRPPPGGIINFAPPSTEILPCAEENYPAAVALIHDAALPHVWIRDNPGDTGGEPSTGYPWESPDIWTVPAVLNQGATVTLHVRVNNSSGTPVNNVTVEAYYTDPRITLEFPSLSSNLIDSKVVNVPATGKDVTFSWVTPVGTNIWGERHWCVGAVIKQDNDMPLTTVVNRSSNIACRNFNTTTIVEGGLLQVAATNYLAVAAELDISFNRDELPQDWKLELPGKEELQRGLKLEPSTVRKSKLLKTERVVLEPGQTIKIPVKVLFEKIPPNDIMVRIKGDLIPLVAGKRIPVGNGYTYQVKAIKK